MGFIKNIHFLMQYPSPLNQHLPISMMKEMASTYSSFQQSALTLNSN